MSAEDSSQRSTSSGSEHGKEPGLALHWKILIGLIGGILAGGAARLLFPSDKAGVPSETLQSIAYAVSTVGQLFLRLILMVVIPLVFCALSLAIVELGDLRKLGRLGFRTFLFTVLFSGLSVVIGLTMANVIRPGERISSETRSMLSEKFKDKAKFAEDSASKAKSVRDSLLDIIPKNPLQEMVGAIDGSSPGGGMLAVMFFSLAFGVAIAVAPKRAGALVSVMEGVYDAVMVIIGFAMRIAPYGVASLVFALTAEFGFDILGSLVWYIAAVLLGLFLQAAVIYSLSIWFFARRSPLTFFRKISDAILTAFATSSSNATLPTALRVTEEELGVSSQVSRFVLTVGSTANQNGTALYEGITVLFLAQVFGVELSLGQQVTVVLMAMMAGIGTAGVPGGSLPLIVVVLQAVKVPADGIAIILGVDRLLDMCRTTLNVTGDIVVAACVDRSEGNAKR